MINSPSFELGGRSFDSITDDFCTTESKAFADTSARTEQNGGLKKMGKDMENGMVLVMSLWDDAVTKMQWLDASFPASDKGKPGYARGPCSLDAGSPDDLIKNHGDATVTYSNIKFGELNSTYSGGGPGPPTPPTPPVPPASGCTGCGYACGGSCKNCGRCNTKPGCMTKDKCMTTCNSGGNAMWCGGDSPMPPTPPTPPTPPPPSGCPGGSLSACIGLCPANPPAVYKACVEDCTKRCT